MAGYIGNIKLKAYLGNVKIKGYLGNVKVLGGEPWEEALDLVGYSASSLEDALGDSDICTALAGNAEATAIMKENYSADMTSAINSNWNEGVNLLSYKCGLKCFLFRGGNQCTAITGGWSASNKGYVNTSVIGINKGSGSSSMVYTNNTVTGSFSKIWLKSTQDNVEFKWGIASAKNSDSWKSYRYSGAIGDQSVAFASGGYPSVRINGDASDRYMAASHVWLE